MDTDLRHLTRGGELLVSLRRPQVRATSYLSLPREDQDSLIDFDPASFDWATRAEMVGRKHLADIKIIEAEDGTAAIRIRAASQVVAKAALEEMKQLIISADAPEVWKPKVLVHPPCSGEHHFTAALQVDNTDGTRRPAARSSDGVIITTAKYKDDLASALDRALVQLRNDPNRLQMRVNFGKVALGQWNKNKTTYSLGELEAALRVAGSREYVSLTGRVTMNAIEALRIALSTRCDSLPEVVRENLEVTKPELSMYLVSKNLAIQCPLEPVTVKEKQATIKHGANRNVKQYAIGTLKGHQRDKNYKKVAIITSCPESHYDWDVEISREMDRPETKAVLPFDAKAVSKFSRFTDKTLEGDFPVVSVMRSFAEANHISEIYGRATWTYQLSIKYALEISIFHIWGADTSEDPITLATISLYSKDWDDDMAVPRELPRSWDTSFAAQFLKPYYEEEAPEPLSGEEHELNNFLSWVHWIQKMLDALNPEEAPSEEKHLNEVYPDEPSD